MSVGLAAVLVAVSETANWHWLSWKTLVAIGIGLVLLALWVRSETRSDHAARRHADDADPRRLDDERGRAAARLRDVLVVHPDPAIRRDAETGRLRLRLLGDAGGALPRADDARAAHRRRADGPAREALRVEAAAARGRRCSRWRRFSCSTFARDARWEIYVAGALLGSGIGLAFAAMANLIIENVGPTQTGVATGMNTVTRTVGGGFGGAVTASILAGTVGVSGYPTGARILGGVPALRGRARRRSRGRLRDPAAAAGGGIRAAPRRGSLAEAVANGDAASPRTRARSRSAARRRDRPTTSRARS